MTNFKSALLIANRRARRGDVDLYTEAIEHLRPLGISLIEVPLDDPTILPDLIRKHQDEVDLVILGGGDGTLNAAADGLVDTQLPFAILPMGTANDLARTLGIPDDLKQACQLIGNGQLHAIDLGWVNGKHFFNVASLGLSTEITQQLTEQRKRKWGVLAYMMTALQTLWVFHSFSAEIHYKDQCIPVRTLQIAIGNGRYYGGGMTVAEDAAIDDHQLDLYSLELQHGWQVVYLLPAMMQGQHIKLPSVRAFRGQEFEVRTDRPFSVNTDGELTTQTPAKFRVIQNAVNVLIPPDVSAETTAGLSS